MAQEALSSNIPETVVSQGVLGDGITPSSRGSHGVQGESISIEQQASTSRSRQFFHSPPGPLKGPKGPNLHDVKMRYSITFTL